MYNLIVKNKFVIKEQDYFLLINSNNHILYKGIQIQSFRLNYIIIFSSLPLIQIITFSQRIIITYNL